MTALNGNGRQSGALRPDFGPGWAELTCPDCGAGWVGPIGEPCGYCQRVVELMREHQAELVARPPDVDSDDQRYAAAIAAWGQRLHRAVAAGLLTRGRARAIYEREVNRGRRAA